MIFSGYMGEGASTVEWVSTILEQQLEEWKQVEEWKKMPDSPKSPTYIYTVYTDLGKEHKLMFVIEVI